jgi:hypothetical protein
MKGADDAMVEVKGLEDFDGKADEVRGLVLDVGFCVIRGIVEPADVLAEYARLAADFDPARDIRRSGPLVRDMPNFQRLDCGDYAQFNARFSRMLTRFMWNPPGHFSRHFDVLQQVRDRIAPRKVTYQRGRYAWRGREYFELPKILQYPAGGGFLNAHRDNDDNDGIINIGMSVTKRGVHFSTGGIFYRHRDGEEYAMEEILEPGDVYVHAEPTVHGVHAVDPQAPIDLARLSGRVALILSSHAFTT